ncbi:MAG TPA: hypothetical protein VHM48_05935 [Candidatus Limnocylindrales bacterium]|nr:hypothetical protein [Candidatus Limnocylindrales bacterium]
MRLIRPSLFAFTAILVFGIPLAFGFLNWRNAERTGYLWNADAKPHDVRVIDLWSGAVVQVGRIGPRSMVLLFHGWPDEWWVNPDTAGDPRRHDLRIEVLGAGCELVSAYRAVTEADGTSNVTEISEGGDVAETEWPTQLSRSKAGALAAIADPCGDATPEPRGVVVNSTRVAVDVGHGLVVPACHAVVVHPGDLLDGSVADPPTPKGAVRVAIPSMDAQDERWPIEPRSVTIAADQIDDSGWVYDGSPVGPCAGRPKPGATADE